MNKCCIYSLGSLFSNLHARNGVCPRVSHVDVSIGVCIVKVCTPSFSMLSFSILSVIAMTAPGDNGAIREGHLGDGVVRDNSHVDFHSEAVQVNFGITAIGQRGRFLFRKSEKGRSITISAK